MQNQSNVSQVSNNYIPTPASLRSSYHSPSFLTNSITSPPVSPRFVPFPKSSNTFPAIIQHETSQLSSEQYNSPTKILLNQGYTRQQKPSQRSKSIYKNHQTRHLLNRIKYLEGIIKEKDKRHKHQLEQQRLREKESLENTSSTTYKGHVEQKTASGSSQKKIDQLEERIKELQQQNVKQRIEYQRKIKQMEEYMETHFVEVESEIMEQSWIGANPEQIQERLKEIE